MKRGTVQKARSGRRGRTRTQAGSDTMPAMGERRIGLVGLGPWGRNHLRVLTRLGALGRAFDIDPGAMAEVEAERRAASFGALLDDPRILGVVIATPARTHFEIAREVLLSGKDALVEKPLTLREDQGRELLDISRERGRVLMAGHITLYHPGIEALTRIIAAGEIGPVRYIYANRLNLGVVREEEDILWSFAPHDIAVFLHALGAWPDTVAAHGGSYLKDGRADVTTTHLKFPGQTRGHIFVSWLHPTKEHRLVVIGELGMLVFEDGPHGGSLHRYPPHPTLRGMPREDPVQIPFPCREPLEIELLHFLDCIAARREPRTGARHGLEVLRILEVARRSLAAAGEPLPCPAP